MEAAFWAAPGRLTPTPLQPNTPKELAGEAPTYGSTFPELLLPVSRAVSRSNYNRRIGDRSYSKGVFGLIFFLFLFSALIQFQDV
jgi:hypothetical protein